MLGYESLDEALAAEPPEMVSVSPELWHLLRDLRAGGALNAEFLGAWDNGRAFALARDGLRSRRPASIEWKGAVRAPGDEVVPADLRVDHVYLISCKYLSRIVLNASPSYLFERLLVGGHGQRSSNWFAEVAPDELQELYSAVIDSLDLTFPSHVSALSGDDRKALAALLRGRWPREVREIAAEFAAVVSERTATRWIDAMATPSARERVLLRLLRIGSAPYFVLGVDAQRSLRLRVETPWDWKQKFSLVSFEVRPVPSEQAVIAWTATVREKRSFKDLQVIGHVEVRWGHGKFNGSPEAKVYLDTPHHLVPGYVAL